MRAVALLNNISFKQQELVFALQLDPPCWMGGAATLLCLTLRKHMNNVQINDGH